MVSKGSYGKVGLELHSHKLERVACGAAVAIGRVERVRDVRSVIPINRFDPIPAAWPYLQRFYLKDTHMTIIAINPSRQSDSGKPGVVVSSFFVPLKHVHHSACCGLPSA